MYKQYSGFFCNSRMTDVWKIVAFCLGLFLLYTCFSYIVYDHVTGDHSLYFMSVEERNKILQKPNKYLPHLTIASVCFVAALTTCFVVKNSKTKVTVRKEKEGTYLDITGLFFKARDMRIHKCIAYIVILDSPFYKKAFICVDFVTVKGKYTICEDYKEDDSYDLPVLQNYLLTKQLLSVKHGVVPVMAKLLGLVGAEQGANK